MDLSLFVGLLGSLALIVGAAWPVEKTKNPRKSVKNWLFGIGGLIMLFYAILWYLSWWSIFFVFLEILIVIASILMMLDTNDRLDLGILSATWIILIVLSLYLFEWYSTIIFILGLAWLGLWYAFKMNTLRRNLALMIGGILVAVFSYISASRIFFWINIFFGLFSLYYTIKLIRSKKKVVKKK